ncbi:MAG TPA: helicase-associated domain-containing protein [Bacillota bacterium]|nr:hypothetical protein [Candidatus Fermentithermobacillaceae bacterium]HOK64192.1 helicase-associated domain-containing protein [Bacillota bacterium]HOL11701.1 helicase-associated domain-containing protein [Bacillota bacterium]HOQ02829.1 helicase-associated domain-containing protein [Bacillota bacterium]HPP60403.1 helicase-associated domain-containing protein [Bacillota bacterium]
MNLKDALMNIPVERLISIANFYGITVPCDSQSDNIGFADDLASSISEHLLVPANALVAMNGLNEEEIIALRLITLSGGGRGVVVEQCHQKLNQLSRKWRRNGFKVIEVLINRGLVFLKREDYRQVYFVPQDLRNILTDFFLASLFQTTGSDPSRFNPRHLVDHAAPLRHMCLFLSYLRKNEVRLTQTGTIFKKAQNELAVLVEESDVDLDQSLFPVRYPPRLAFLIYFAKSKSLCEERSDTLRLGSQANAWIESPYSQWRRDLYDYWLQTFIAQDPDLNTMYWIIMNSPENSVISVDKLLEEMDTLSTSHSSHGLDLRVERNLISMLEYLGALDVAQARGETLVRVTPMGRALFGTEPWPEEVFDTYIYVQSNFEILVPCTVEPRILWAIDTFAQNTKVDQMMVFKLTKNSVYRAMLHGYTPDLIHQFLAEHSKTPLPQNVVYSISHWGTSYGRIEFEDVILLKCDSDELADELMMSPKINIYLKKKVGPGYLVVDRESYESLVAALSEEGYMPKVGAGTARVVPKKATQQT